MEDNSPEYRTLIDLTSELGLAVRSNLISLSGALLSARLISPDNDTELRNKFHIEADRAARLVELVQNKVRQNFRHYYTFVGILRGTPGQYSDILQKLDRACAPHQEEDSTYIAFSNIIVDVYLPYLYQKCIIIMFQVQEAPVLM